MMTTIRVRPLLLATSMLVVLLAGGWMFGGGLSAQDATGSEAQQVSVPDAVDTTTVLPAVADTWVNEGLPTTNYGADKVLYVARASNQRVSVNARTLLAFKLPTFPSGTVITNASLELYQVNASGAAGYNVWPDALLRPWTEMAATWDNQPPFTNAGDPLTSLDLTNGWKKWDVTNIVVNWSIGKLDNYGILLRGDGDTLGVRAFETRTDQNPPKLTITYRLPATSTPTATAVVPTRTPTATSPAPTRTPTATSPAPTRTPTATSRPPTRTPTATPTQNSIPPIQAFPYLPLHQVLIPFPLTSDLSIHGIEITQGVQCFDTSQGLAGCPNNSLPVVAKKDATARIYLKYSGLLGSQNSVPVRLHIRANGVWYTANATGRGTPALDQGATDSADIYFNVNFSNDVLVDFYAVVDPNNTIVESNESNNRHPASGYITLNFRKRDTMKIVGQRLRYHPSGYGGTQYAGGWAVNGGGADWFEQLLPIRNNGINYSVKSGYLDWTSTLSTGGGQHSLIQYLNTRWILQNALSWMFGSDFLGAQHVYGWAPDAGYSGGHADMPVYPHAGGLGVVGIGTDRPGTGTDNPGGGAYIFGHELVHDYNMYHTNTGGDDCGSNDSNSDFPYGTSSIQEFGFNPITGKIYDPATTHDIMSYCPAGGSMQGWVSPFTWNRMFNNLSTTALNAVAASADQPTVGVMQATDSAESLVVNVTVYNPDVSAQKGGKLDGLHRVTGGVVYPVPAGDYTVELRKGSSVLRSASFVVNFESEYDGHSGPGEAGTPNDDDPPFPSEDTSQADIHFIMPWEPGTTSVALVYKGAVLDQRAVSQNAPTVKITEPAGAATWPAGSSQTIRWQGSDVDGGSLQYTVMYSYDGGGSWELLASDLTDTSFSLIVDSLKGGGDVRFRVVANDGVNLGFGETKGPISVPDKAPYAFITNPNDGQISLPGALVVLQGAATDLEDGGLSDGALVWSSDRQGELGSGPSMPVNTLAPGKHTITLVATDSTGNKGSASVALFIGHARYVPLVLR